MVLIDTSIIIDFINRNKYREVLADLLAKRRFCTTGVIIMEVLQGVKDDGSFAKIKSFMESLPLIECEYDDFIKAADIYRTCRKKGITIRKSIDCIIAAIVINHHLELLSNDVDFDNIRKHFELNYYSL